MSIADSNRKQIRAIFDLDKTRPDGSRFTKPSSGSKRSKSRAKNSVAKQARKVNRGRD